ncbi:MAG: DUF3047 domain-containing protein [Rhizobiales bacterium]|nr:DUF3047 domain-containing protein [Hyphomicrobiales bacterium]
MVSKRTRYIAYFSLSLVVGMGGFLTYKSLQGNVFNTGNPLLVSAEKGGIIALVDADFDINNLPLGWVHRIFFNTNPTKYKLAKIDGKVALHCSTDNSGSILARDMNIKLSEFGQLKWQWLIEKPLESDIDEASEAGDDHPARFFVIFNGDEGVRNSAEIIWSNKRFAAGDYKIIGNFYHLVANGLNENVGKWHQQSVDLAALYNKIGGKSANPSLSLLGFFCDSDNTGGTTSAYFADVRLVK